MNSNEIQTAFPRKSSHASICSDNDKLSEPNIDLKILRDSTEILQDTLSDAAKFAFADLIASVLRMDFWEETIDDSKKFCRKVLNFILQRLGMPPRTNDSIICHLNGDIALGDVTSLIVMIKNDPFITKTSTKVLVICLLTFIIDNGEYDCRYRVLLRHLSALLTVLWDDIENVEDALTDNFFADQEEYVESSSGILGASRVARQESRKFKKLKRYALIGAASGVGGMLIGLTGGLAAPLVAAGAGIVLGTGAAAGIATATGAAVLGSVFGITGAGLTGYKMKKRVGAVEEFVVEPLSEEKSLHCVLVVSGWIEEEDNFAFHRQWRDLKLSREQYTLRYESKYIIELGRAMEYLVSFAVSVAIQKALMETAISGLLTAMTWPIALLSVSSVIDNPWNVCISRASEIGDYLADILLCRSHGRRPITLIGFSIGARVIFQCLLTMSKRNDCLGIVENVVLLGAPVSASSKQWHQISRIIGGRIINGYCKTDWLLRFLYRTMNAQFTIAGTGPIDSKKDRKIVNFDLSHIVKGHLDYSHKLSEVLEAVGIRVTPHIQSESSMDNNGLVLNAHNDAT